MHEYGQPNLPLRAIAASTGKFTHRTMLLEFGKPLSRETLERASREAVTGGQETSLLPDVRDIVRRDDETPNGQKRRWSDHVDGSRC